MEVFPPEVKEVWNIWQVRVLILASLILQLVLFKLGSRRKRIAKVWIKATLWTTYLLADWVAIVALGVISKNMEQGCRCKDKDQDHHPINKGARINCINTKDLNAFWAPFLLLHLGGPDTITAYSLEDNELWRRHLLILVPQLGVTVYILLMACRPGSVSWVSISSFLMMVPGVIKYVERTWALRMANTENFRASMLTSPDSGPNYRKFVEEFSLRKAEGFYVKVDEVVEEVIHQQPRHHHDDGAAGQQSLVPIAYDLFQIFRRLFVDLILSFQDREHSQKIFMEFSTQAAFQVVEIELGFAYDVLYTKAPVLFSCAGCILRLISFSFTFSVSVLFLAVELLHTDCNRDILADCIITWLLLIAGVVLEIYAVWRLLRSDWAEYYYYYYYYHHHHRWLTSNLSRKLLHRGNHQHRWSNSMAQYNLLSFSLQYKPLMWEGAQQFLGIHDKLEQHRHTSFVSVSMELKDLIFKRFLEASKDADNRLTALSKFRGGLVLEDEGRRPSYRWSDTVEFDQSVLTWHVATDICLRSGRDQQPPEGGSGTVAGRVLSEHLSNYMLYLLVMCPLTFPIGIGMIRFKDTCAEAKGEEQRDPTEDLNKYCKRLLQVNTEVLPEKVKGDRSKSVLFDACRTAKLLLSMETRKRWETMSHAWVEILAYAAMHCRGNNHARQLRKGGELLTHVWLLMAHLGITDQFQIKRGHVRAKLRLQ